MVAPVPIPWRMTPAIASPGADATASVLYSIGYGTEANKVPRELADSFALYIKTKNFHWHVSGPHFRSYHLMLDEQSDAIFATTDELVDFILRGIAREDS